MTWTEFACQRWGHHWGLCRNTAANRARYDRCVTNSEYNAAQAAYRKAHTADALRGLPTSRFSGDLAADLFEALENMLGPAPQPHKAHAVIRKARGG